jgi:hypothetical protein
MAISHPSEQVQVQATSLPRRLWRAYTGSRAHVSALLGHGEDLEKSLTAGKTVHQDAVDALAKLVP